MSLLYDKLLSGLMGGYGAGGYNAGGGDDSKSLGFLDQPGGSRAAMMAAMGFLRAGQPMPAGADRLQYVQSGLGSAFNIMDRASRDAREIEREKREIERQEKSDVMRSGLYDMKVREAKRAEDLEEQKARLPGLLRGDTPGMTGGPETTSLGTGDPQALGMALIDSGYTELGIKALTEETEKAGKPLTLLNKQTGKVQLVPLAQYHQNPELWDPVPPEKKQIRPYEPEREKQLAEIYAADFKEVTEGEAAARKQLEQVSLMQTLPAVGLATGAIEPLKNRIRSLAVGLGWNLTETQMARLETSEQFLALQQTMVQTVLNQQTGTKTDNDAERAEFTLANLTNTPEANEFVNNYLHADATRAINKSTFYRKWLADNKGRFTREKDGKTMGTAWQDYLLETPIFKTVEIEKGGPKEILFVSQYVSKIKTWARTHGKPMPKRKDIIETWRGLTDVGIYQ